ncbi:MAG: thermonuclease family protein [Porphyrobacter sp.]|nr:thermonuclease family protein [Porphyrobacter sp.]
MSCHRLLMLFTALLAAPLNAQVMTGPATVIDGDTIEMTGMRIRLVGIDAPESKQLCNRANAPWACGEEASVTLAQIIGGQPLQCTAQGQDSYGRTLAVCQTRTLDIGREMVRRGMAITRDNAPPNYADSLNIARQLGYGLWSGSFETPAAWRAANPRADTPAPRMAREDGPAPANGTRPRPASGQRYTNQHGCAIKGNHSPRGEWIYHLPGQKYYEQTRPEALFCTEHEAMAAGYRRSRA